MSVADRCAVISLVAIALAMSTNLPGLTIAAFIAIWWAYIELSVSIRHLRRQGRREPGSR